MHVLSYYWITASLYLTWLNGLVPWTSRLAHACLYKMMKNSGPVLVALTACILYTLVIIWLRIGRESQLTENREIHDSPAGWLTTSLRYCKMTGSEERPLKLSNRGLPIQPGSLQLAVAQLAPHHATYHIHLPANSFSILVSKHTIQLRLPCIPVSTLQGTQVSAALDSSTW